MAAGLDHVLYHGWLHSYSVGNRHCDPLAKGYQGLSPSAIRLPALHDAMRWAADLATFVAMISDTLGIMASSDGNILRRIESPLFHSKLDGWLSAHTPTTRPLPARIPC